MKTVWFFFFVFIFVFQEKLQLVRMLIYVAHEFCILKGLHCISIRVGISAFVCILLEFISL